MSMEDVIKLSDKQLQQQIIETEARLRLRAQNHNLKGCLWGLIHAVGRLLDDKYTEGDAAVRKEAWTAMHRAADEAREYLENIDNQKTTPQAMVEKLGLEKGMKVTYCPSHGAKEHGIVKSFNDEIAFVVYKCGGEWDNYENYTGAATNISDLKKGWL